MKVYEFDRKDIEILFRVETEIYAKSECLAYKMDDFLAICTGLSMMQRRAHLKLINKAFKEVRKFHFLGNRKNQSYKDLQKVLDKAKKNSIETQLKLFK